MAANRQTVTAVIAVLGVNALGVLLLSAAWFSYSDSARFVGPPYIESIGIHGFHLTPESVVQVTERPSRARDEAFGVHHM